LWVIIERESVIKRMQRTPMLSSSTTVQHDETERLRSLLQYDILDTLPDPAFDEIARMAAAICCSKPSH
jgi:hypothetical protein